MEQFIYKFLRVFDPPKDRNAVCEDPDQLGYTLIKSGSITPSIYRGVASTAETRRILCEIMPATEWLALEANALDEGMFDDYEFDGETG